MVLGQALGTFGLVLDVVAAGLLVVADFPARRARLLQHVDRIPGVDSSYAKLHRGIKQLQDDVLTQSDPSLRVVIDYLLAYPGTLPPDADERIRVGTAAEYVHRERRFGPVRQKLQDVTKNPLFEPIALADEVEISLSPSRDQIRLIADGSVAEYSRWHDTERIHDELYRLFVRYGFLLLVAGFLLQLAGNLATDVLP